MILKELLNKFKCNKMGTVASFYDLNSICPNCGSNDCTVHIGNVKLSESTLKNTSIYCNTCGFSINPVLNYLPLKKLNELRVKEGLEPLKQQPEQKVTNIDIINFEEY